jgi:hypothetical protein
VHGTFQGSDSVTGKIGKAINFNDDASNEYINASLGALSAPYTAEAWIYFDDLNQASSDYDYTFMFYNGTGTACVFSVSREAGSTANKDKFYNYDGVAQRFGPVLNGQQWVYLVLEATTSGNYTALYINGSSVSLDASTSALNSNGNLEMGRYSAGFPHWLDGKIDELKVSTAALSTEWILTSYNNQNSPAAFFSLGSEEPKSAANAPIATLNQPNGSQAIGSVYSVDFNVSDADSGALNASLYYSQQRNDFNLFIADLNLGDYPNYSGLSCGSSIFLTTTNCTYDWNLYRPGVSVKDSNLVLFMPLDTYSFRDFSPLANNGSATTFDKTASSGVVSGKINRAMKFDGVDDYISAADADRLDLRTNDFTIELWAVRSASGATHVLVDKRPDVSNGYVLQFNASNQVEAQICNGTCTTIISTSTVTDTGWHYIAIEFDRSANAQIYLDGSADGSATSISAKSAGINTAANLRIVARSFDSLANVMNGSIDEVRIYDKLLGAAEIRKRYSMVQGTDLNRVADGNYFLDLNVWDQTDLNAIDSSNTSFAVDNNAPGTTDNAPSTTQSSAFTVTLSCDDTSYIAGIQASGCSYSNYRFDSGSWKQSSAVAVNDDGNHKIDYYSVDAAGNAGAIRTTYGSLLLTGHSFNFGLRFDGNWWDSSVHIPGFVVDQNMQNTVSQTLTQGSTFDYASFSRNGLAIGLVSTGATYLMDLTNVYPSTFNIYLQQAHRAGVDKEFYLAYTSGNYTAFEDKKVYVRNGEFLKRVNPAFGVATTALYTITLGLDYFDSNVDINGSFHLGPGSHSLLITNQGTSNGKVVIGISKD